ncbi:hypothetical protein CELL_02651 [Cellulomonas sp. T2.31MG-18]
MRSLPGRLLVVGAAAALLLSACGRADAPAATGQPSSTVAATATGTVTMWAMGAEGDKLGAFVKAFESANPGVTVNVTSIPWNAAHDKIQTAIAGGTTPDISMMGTTWMTDFADSFAAVPAGLTSADFFPGALANGKVKGANLGLPWYIDTRLLYYRTDIAAKAGWTKAPTTWDELKQMASDMKTKGGAKVGINLPAAGSDSFQATLWMPWSNGADVMNADGTKWTLDSPQMVDAYKYLESFFADGSADANYDGANTQADFVSGALGMFIDGPWNIGGLKDTGGADFASKYATAVLPTKASSTAFAGGSNLVVYKGAKNPGAAWALAKWLTDPKVQADFFKLTGDLPAVQSAWKDPALASDPKLAAFGAQLKDVKSPPNVATWTHVSAAADAALESMTRGGVDPATALANLQKQADQIGVG